MISSALWAATRIRPRRGAARRSRRWCWNRAMSVEDAAIEMELLGHNFFAFVNIDTDRTNVLYLRKDGDLGLLEPEA